MRKRFGASLWLLVFCNAVPGGLITGMIGRDGVAVAQTLPPSTQSRSFTTDLDAWLKAHPDPKNDAPQEERDAFQKERADASARWVKDWPDEAAARYWRLDSMDRLKTTPNEEVDRLGEEVLLTLREHPIKGVMFTPYQLLVAEIWSNRKIRLTQCLDLTDEALVEIERMRTANPLLAKHLAGPMENGVFHTLRVQADIALAVPNLAKARAAVDRMKQWVDDNPQMPSFNQRAYLMRAARLAEAEGHKLDALTYYQLLLSQGPSAPEQQERARAIWSELGGTADGFAVWSTLQQAKRPGTAEQPSAWAEMRSPLQGFEGVDLAGKRWTVRDFKGKTTLVNVWASWCAPCRAELPAVQRLFDQLKDRTDVQVVTVNTDDNPAMAAPVLKDLHYTFPVIFMRYSQVEGLVGMSTIPQTWILDGSGTVRLGRAGYEKGDWPQAMLDRMAGLK